MKVKDARITFLWGKVSPVTLSAKKSFMQQTNTRKVSFESFNDIYGQKFRSSTHRVLTSVRSSMIEQLNVSNVNFMLFFNDSMKLFQTCCEKQGLISFYEVGWMSVCLVLSSQS